MTRQFYQGRTPFNLAQRDRLVAALPPGSDLRERMVKCGTLSQVTHGYALRCKAPGCPSCRSLHATRNRRKAQEAFDGASNERSAHVTIIFAALSELGAPEGGDMDRAIEKARRDLRNFVDRMRTKDRRWRNFTLIGWLEVDAVDGADLPLLASDRGQLLAGLGARVTAAPVWIATMHGLTRFDGLPWQEVRDAFASQWSLANQVKVEPFHGHLTVDQNVENLVAYALKHRCTTSIGGAHHPWPARWMSDFYQWLDQWSGSLKRTRIKLGSQQQARDKDKKNNKKDNMNNESIDEEEDGLFDHHDPLPFTLEISVFSSLY